MWLNCDYRHMYNTVQTVRQLCTGLWWNRTVVCSHLSWHRTICQSQDKSTTREQNCYEGHSTTRLCLEGNAIWYGQPHKVLLSSVCWQTGFSFLWQSEGKKCIHCRTIGFAKKRVTTKPIDCFNKKNPWHKLWRSWTLYCKMVDRPFSLRTVGKQVTYLWTFW